MNTLDNHNAHRHFVRIAKHRRGAAAVLGVFLIATMAIILSMSVDLGYIYNSESELQRTCDAAALAGCWELFDAKVNGVAAESAKPTIFNSAESFAMANVVANSAPRLSQEGVLLGNYNIEARTFSPTVNGDVNAVRVSVHRQKEINGEVNLFFGGVLGRPSQPITVSSTAALVQNVQGFFTPGSETETIDVLPFALDEVTWNAVLNGQTQDSFTFNGSVHSGQNGLYECNLYPQGTGSPGNRGTVDIGGANNSTSDIARQILHGISREDLLAMQSPFEFDANGELELNGDTGISAGVKDELAAIIGEKRVIPIFRSVSGNGNNAMYTIVKFAGVRILDVKLTGKMNQKRVIVEPAPIVARHVKIATNDSFRSDYVFAPVMLVN